MSYFLLHPLFPLGTVLCSPSVENLHIDINRLIRRHQGGDWGTICEDDQGTNEHAISNSEPILSQYAVVSLGNPESRVVIMTEGDRSLTVVFLSDDPVDTSHEE